jgi:hypothetical protein
MIALHKKEPVDTETGDNFIADELMEEAGYEITRSAI